MEEAARPRSDALVLFGITGDLAYQKIVPALQEMVRHRALEVPVVGVARSGWSRDTLLDRMRASLEDHGGIDEAAFARFAKRFEYVDGDYTDPATFERLREALGEAKRPLYYLAIPPSLFEAVIQNLEGADLVRDARVVIEKPFGRDLASARELNARDPSRLPRGLDLPDRSLPRQGAGAEPRVLPVRERVPGAAVEPELRAQRADHDGREVRRAQAWRVLRAGRHDPRRRAEPPAPGARARGDGAAERASTATCS